MSAVGASSTNGECDTKGISFMAFRARTAYSARVCQLDRVSYPVFYAFMWRHEKEPTERDAMSEHDDAAAMAAAALDAGSFNYARMAEMLTEESGERVTVADAWAIVNEPNHPRREWSINTIDQYFRRHGT